MPTREDFMNRPSRIKAEINAHFGAGKTTLGMTFPKVFYIGTEPDGLEILRSKEGAHLLPNLVHYEEIYLDPLQGRTDVKQTVEEANQEGLLYKAVQLAHKMAKAGQVETLMVDNVTYLAEFFWMYLERYKKADYTTADGSVNTLKMYGDLQRWLFRFMISWVISFPGHVVVTAHLKTESEEKMKRKKAKDVDLVPNILGGFRDQAEGLFTCSLYLERRLISKKNEQTGKIEPQAEFLCYTQNQIAMGSKILAKNRHGWPPMLRDVS